MRRSCCSFAVVAVALAACSHAAPTPSGPAEVPVAPASSAPAAVASASRPADGSQAPEVPEAKELDCSNDAFAVRRYAVDAAEARGDVAALRKAIAAALEIRPRIYGYWVTLAQLHLKEGALDEAAIEGRILVELNDAKEPFGWFLQGLAAESHQRPAEARAFFARSALADPQGDGARKLGAASRCTAIAYAPDRDDRVELVKGWRGVFASVELARMVHEDRPAPTTDAEARARACVHSDMTTVTERDICKGKGPWVIRTGHQHFHDFETLVLPLQGGQFGLVSYFTGMACRGGASLTARLVGSVIEVKNAHTRGRLADTSDCDREPRDALSSPCIAAIDRATTYYDARTGQALLTLDDRDESEKVELKGTRVKRGGIPGCDETIDLLKLPPNLPARPTH